MGKGKSPIAIVLVGVMGWAGLWMFGVDVPGGAQFYCPRAETRAAWHAYEVKQAQDPRCASISRP